MAPGFGFTVMVSVVVLAHWPAVGVNVYVVVAVLFNAGLHVPVMPFNEAVGKVAKVAPEHMGGIKLKVGVMLPGEVIAAAAVLVHPLVSFTVIVYEPAARPVKILLL